MKTYDAIIVLGMNIRKTDHGYRPTTYADHDEYGMLAGEMNTIAAAQLFLHHASNTFVFSTGTSQKTKAKYGPHAPTEARVYSHDFLQKLPGKPDRRLNIVMEGKSVNTYSNMTECIQITKRHRSWKKIAIMSARYHIPRVQALWSMATLAHPLDISVDFLVAEDIIEHYLPGEYTQVIQAAYISPQGLKRVSNEIQGLEDMKSGKYVVTEFQLSQPPAEHARV